MSTGLYRLLWRRFNPIERSLGEPRKGGTERRRLKALTAVAVGAVLLAGAGIWLMTWIDDGESADRDLVEVAGTATASKPIADDNASNPAKANQAGTIQSPGSADPVTVGLAVQDGTAAGSTIPAAAIPTPTAGPSQANAAPETTAPDDKPTASLEPPALSGLRISSQSWRRGGLGSKALVTFTLRNSNPYAVGDLALACAFSRRDGTHLTDRTRIVPGTVNMKSRKTFAAVHVGFVNVNASKAKCTLVTARKI